MYVDYGYMITFCCMCIYISVSVCLLRKGLGCALSLHYSFHGIFLGPALRGLYRCVCVSACLHDFSTFHNVSNINCYCLDNTQVPSPRIIQPIRSRIGAVLGKEFCYLTVFIKMVISIMAMDTLKCL